MKLDEFVTQLSLLLPNKDVFYNARGYHLPEADFKEYILPKKNTSSEFSILENPNIIYSLVENYQAEYIQFGDYTFSQEIEKIDNLNIFAYSSGTCLAIREGKDEVIELDYQEDYLLIGQVAKDSESFLKCILKLQEQYSLRMQNIIDTDDDIENIKFLKDCIELSGGIKYESFYRYLIMSKNKT